MKDSATAIAYGFVGLIAGFVITTILFDDPQIRTLLALTLGCVGFVIGHRKNLQQPAPVSYPPRPVLYEFQGLTHGTANWENPEYIGAMLKDKEFNEAFIDGPGFYIGETYNISTPMHAVCVAGSGQGKGVNLIIPNLLKTPFASWFVIDPKGENAKITARWQKQMGQKVVILDPWNEQKRLGATHGIEPVGFNPLHFAKDNADEMPEICGLIAHMLVPDAPGSKDEYWSSRARSLVKTYILHLITALPEEDHHLGTIYKWLRLSGEEDRPKLWVDMRLNEACDGLIQDGINQFYGMSDSDGPLPSIISTAQDNTEFLSSMALRTSLIKNDFDPYDLTNGETTVYLCLPERFVQSHARWLRLVVGVCLKACNYRPNKRVNFLLDEFAILGKMPDIERAFAFARGQNISMWIFMQSLTQLMDIYGQNGADAFLSNARLRQFFGIFDLQTQKYVSEYLGDTTIDTTTKSTSFSSGTTSGQNGGSNTSKSESYNKQSTGRRLLTVEEVGKEEKIITLIDGYKFRLARLPYWDSIFKAYEQKRYHYYPLSDQAWHTFCDYGKQGDSPDRPDIKNIFLPRADAITLVSENNEMA